MRHYIMQGSHTLLVSEGCSHEYTLTWLWSQHLQTSEYSVSVREGSGCIECVCVCVCVCVYMHMHACTCVCVCVCTYNQEDVQVLLKPVRTVDTHTQTRTHYTLELNSPVHILLQTPISYQCWVTLQSCQEREGWFDNCREKGVYTRKGEEKKWQTGGGR